MLIVISGDAEFRSTAVGNLSPLCGAPVVAVQNLAVALSIIEDNEVHAVVAHEPSASHPLARSFGRRHPQVECISVTRPVDWQGLTSRLSERSNRDESEQCVVACGAEELLGLLAMMRRSADVDVTAGENHGRLTIREGHIVDARIGRECGTEAAIRILGWEGARVKSHPDLEGNVEPTMYLPISVALHEAARRRDELGRISARADVDEQIGWLASMRTVDATLLADCENCVPLVERGRSDEATRRRLWSAVELSRVHPRGVALWGESAIALALPIGAAVVLAVASRDQQQVTELRRLLAYASRGLRGIIEDTCSTDDSMDAVASLPW